MRSVGPFCEYYVLQLVFLHTLLQDYDFYISRIVIKMIIKSVVCLVWKIVIDLTNIRNRYVHFDFSKLTT